MCWVFYSHCDLKSYFLTCRKEISGSILSWETGSLWAYQVLECRIFMCSAFFLHWKEGAALWTLCYALVKNTYRDSLHVQRYMGCCSSFTESKKIKNSKWDLWPGRHRMKSSMNLHNVQLKWTYQLLGRTTAKYTRSSHLVHPLASELCAALKCWNTASLVSKQVWLVTCGALSSAVPGSLVWLPIWYGKVVEFWGTEICASKREQQSLVSLKMHVCVMTAESMESVGTMNRNARFRALAR